jgi:hypothetical protein
VEVFTPSGADSSSTTTHREEILELKSTPRLGLGDSTARRMQENNSTPALIESSSSSSQNPASPSSQNNLADLDLESTVSRHHVIDTNSIVRAHSSRNMNSGRRHSSKPQILTDNLSPLTVQDFKKEDDKQQISDLLSVASLENSIEAFPDDLDDSTSTLGSGRVLLESLDGMGSLISQEGIKGAAIHSSRNLADVKVGDFFTTQF